ncbi:MAG: hypothetical protein FWC40_06255 [Proteobacteria bacterium]|nr:hypothetical protein [Pseudomonadota bacterium]
MGQPGSAKKILTFIGGAIVLIAAASLYMFLTKLEPRDFVRLPDGVLDDAIYAAQQKDLKAFKRNFTKDIQDRMQQMHDSNMNRELGSTSGKENTDLFWTWDTLMSRMATQGGFEVKKTSTKFIDYIIEGKAKVEIVYVDKARGGERQKNYTLHRTGGVWRIDLQSDPDFVKAYNQSVRSFRTTGRDSDVGMDD